MKFLQLTGIIMLLSQATSISAATLLPRSSSSGSMLLSNPMVEVFAAIKRYENNPEKWKSPDSIAKMRAKTFNYPFLIPFHVDPSWNKNCHENYITKGSDGKLNVWVVISDNGTLVRSGPVLE
ncbi:BgTH12-06429 [Blumeria graminis f. sp. triticale]|uniref:BgTH12-06429 n=1 Tax=Blumeria graminis f. sp. triticale TaxID=1689686 RepID=A0A9W4GCP4_BLUGR|nr:BgTH12-06429 [Blumeria graminis f. sp. triticale]